MSRLSNDSLPRAGDLVYHDYRVERSDAGSISSIKCVQWNIERGYQLDRVISVLKEQNADILCLQELDISCERSDFRDCAMEIAQVLELKCVFLTEFEELHSPKRPKHTQGGGVHGNAILSRFDFEAFVVAHSHHPIDWEVVGEGYCEPRRGARAVLGASINVPGLDSAVIVYTLHLEVFCGMLDRVRQFSDVLFDSQRRQINDGSVYQIICGDLNTLGHGTARFHLKYCRDSMRFGSLGYSESDWWKHHLFDCVISERELSDPSLTFHNERLAKFNLASLGNNHFVDPFDPESHPTYALPQAWYTGKLDWILLRGWQAVDRQMANMDYKASDHCLLAVEMVPVVSEDGSTTDPGPLAFELSESRSLRRKWWSLYLALSFLVLAVTVVFRRLFELVVSLFTWK